MAGLSIQDVRQSTDVDFRKHPISELEVAFREWVTAAAAVGASSLQIVVIHTDYRGKISVKLNVTAGENVIVTKDFSSDLPIYVKLHLMQTLANQSNFETSLKRKELNGPPSGHVLRLVVAW